MTRYIWSKEG